MNLIKIFILLFLFGTLQATNLKAIRIMGENAPMATAKELQEAQGVQFFEIQVPGSEKTLASQLSHKFIGKPIESDTTAHLQQAIERYYQEYNHPLMRTVIPQQEVTNGVIQVRVIESRVGKIKVTGNRYTSKDLLISYLSIGPNDTIDVRDIRKSLDFENRNPFRRVDMVYGPGEQKNTTDLTLYVNDRRPLRLYVGTDNSGVENTDRGRLFAGFNAAKVFSLDHFFTYQYTASYDLHLFQAHTVQYVAYLSWKHLFNVYGGYSSAFANLPFPSAKNHGNSYQASGRYVIPLNPLQRLTHEWGVGFDFKRTNNTIEFLEPLPTVGPNVNLTQFVGHYAGNWVARRSRFDYQAEIFYSPGKMVSDESNAGYQSLRPGAKNHWVYGRGYLKYFQKFSWPANLTLMLRGQLSSQNLLPSEQLGLGGFETVRGYDERQLNFDSGLIVNAELSTHSFSLLHRRFNSTKWKDGFQALLFFDYGYGGNHTPIFMENKTDYLMGVGPALRYLIDPWITIRVDLGFKLHRDRLFTGGNYMWHFSFIASY